MQKENENLENSEKSATFRIKRNNLLENYKILEDVYIDQGKTEKFITGSGLFKDAINSGVNCIILTEGNKDDNEKVGEYNSYQQNSKANLNKKLSNIKNLVLEKFEKEKEKNYKNMFLIENRKNSNVEKVEPANQKEIPIINNNHLLEKEISPPLDNYDILIEAKSQIREQNQNILKKKIEDEMKPHISKKIYLEEYRKIEDNFRKEFEDKLKEEIFSIKIQEFEKIKSNIKNIQNSSNLQDLKEKCKSQLKNEYDDKMQKQLDKKELEIKTNFLRKLEVFKNKLEHSLKEEFENKKKEFIKEISRAEADDFCQKTAERIRKKKCSQKSSGKNSDREENINENKLKRNNSSVTFELTGKQINLSVIDDILPKEKQIDRNQSERGRSSQNFTHPKLCQEVNDNLRTVNIKELNKKLKSMSQMENLNYNPHVDKPDEKNREVSLLFKDYTNYSLKEDLENLILKNINSEKRTLSSSDVDKENYKKPGKEIVTYKKYKNKNVNEKIENVKKNEKIILNEIEFNSNNQQRGRYECISLKIEESTPISMKEFGIFILNYIEREENFKIFLENNQSKLIKAIRKKFKQENRNDHCLTDLLIELWDNLEVSYQQRYFILINFLKSENVFQIYAILDKETEILSDYFEKAEDIYSMIKTRERKKSILQAKINRNEILETEKEKFVKFTREISSKIKLFKEKYNLNIIWRGLVYEWIINYETWLSMR